MSTQTEHPVDAITAKHGALPFFLDGNGNAFAVMARFRSAARRAGWPQEAIDSVLEEAKSSNYDHLLATLLRTTR